MKALIDKTRLKFNGVITPKLKTELEDSCGLIELEGREGIFIIPAGTPFRQIREVLEWNSILEVRNVEDLYHFGSYILPPGSDARPNLLALINSLDTRIKLSNNILKQEPNLKLLVEMINCYNNPVSIY